MWEAFDGQHQTGRGRQWTTTRYQVYCGVERARLAPLVISFHFVLVIPVFTTTPIIIAYILNGSYIIVLQT